MSWHGQTTPPSAPGAKPRVHPKTWNSLQKKVLATTRNEALRLSRLWALVEATQTAEIAIGGRLHHEDLHLMMGHADLLLGQQLIQRSTAGFPQSCQIIQPRNPHRQVHVTAFVPDGNARLPIVTKSRYFFLQR